MPTFVGYGGKLNWMPWGCGVSANVYYY